MKYVIAHKEGGYLYRRNNNGWCRTNNIENAELLDYAKALNVLNNSISSSMRPSWEIITAEDAYLALRTCAAPKSIPFGDFDWEAITCHQQLLYQDLKRYGVQLSDELSQVDLEICDIQHYIEFFNLDAARGYKAYRMLKERLQRRREIKEEIAKTNLLLNGSSTDYSSGKISRQIENFNNKSYTPRVLSELFDLDNHGKYSPLTVTEETKNLNCA